MYEESIVIYADVLFLINFFIDFLCLFAAGRLCSRSGRLPKILLGAAAGALYSFIPYFIEFPLFPVMILHIAAAYAVTLIAFGRSWIKKDLLTAGAFIITEALLGGAVTAVYGGISAGRGKPYTDINPFTLIAICAASAALAFIYGIVFKKQSKVSSAEIKIFVGDEIMKATLLTDSGNLVTEPFSALPVIIISASALPFPFDSPESNAFPLPIRAIPFTTSAGKGCFFGFKPDRIEIMLPAKKAKRAEAFIGVDTGCTSYSGYDGLLPASLL